MNDATRKLLNLPLTIDPYIMPLIERKEKLASENREQNEQDEQDEHPDISDIIREETQDGRSVVRFLVSAMQGEIDDFKPCHRLDAARQLIKFGYDPAQSFLDAHMSIEGPASASAMRPRSQAEPRQELHPDLARVIAEETQNGRIAVRFLVEVMLGERPEFKPRHRINSARELLRLGFPTHTETQPEPQPESEMRDDPYITLADGRKVYYEGHDPTCNCRSRLTDCFGSPDRHIDLEPEGIKGRAERAAFDEAFPDYVPPTDAELRRIVAERIHYKNPDAPWLCDIPLPFVKDEARKLFERDRREKSGEKPNRPRMELPPDNQRPPPT